eukprot:c4201_g1_i1.p1 GENE.c4201_g1_i1~~c4201_g1_i1.p1  ORF type:complete len:346 (-),score=52.74 c4201_g1_i1:128-1165(-)
MGILSPQSMRNKTNRLKLPKQSAAAPKSPPSPPTFTIDFLAEESPLHPEKVIGKRVCSKRGLQYLFQWQGKGEEYNEWKQPEEVPSAKFLIQAFENQNPDTRGKRARSPSPPPQQSHSSITSDFHPFCIFHTFEHAVAVRDYKLAAAVSQEVPEAFRNRISPAQLVLFIWEDASKDIKNRVQDVEKWLRMFCTAVPRSAQGLGTNCRFLELVKELIRHAIFRAYVAENDSMQFKKLLDRLLPASHCDRIAQLHQKHHDDLGDTLSEETKVALHWHRVYHRLRTKLLEHQRRWVRQTQPERQKSLAEYAATHNFDVLFEDCLQFLREVVPERQSLLQKLTEEMDDV